MPATGGGRRPRERRPDGGATTPSRSTNGQGKRLAPEELFEEWRNAAYNCFSSGHKFCREVCP